VKSLLRLLFLSILTAVLSACSLFGGDDDEKLEPTELLDFDQTMDVQKIWSDKVGDGSEFLRLSLKPAGDGAKIYAASFDGNVTAYDPESGKRLWRTQLKQELSAGPGVGDNYVVVVSLQGDLICLSASDGVEIWRVNVDGESVAPPLVKNEIIVVATIDGKLRGYSVFDGVERWVLEQQMPALTLRGSSIPVIVGSTVVAGFDNGRLVAAELSDGAVEWESMLSQPTGRSDLERLADIDGAIATVGQDVYAAGYHGRLAALAAESGQILWSREISSYAGLGADWENIYAVSDEGELIGMLRRNGTELWRQTAMVRREPTAPVSFDTAVAVGDFEGYVHLFDSGDGTPVARIRVGKGMISGVPAVIGGRLIVQSESGQIAAFTVKQPERPQEPTDEETDEETGEES
jgi:outer membrane protein assembly factor BamB